MAPKIPPRPPRGDIDMLALLWQKLTEVFPLVGVVDNMIAAIRAAVTGGTLPGGNPLGDFFNDVLGLFFKADNAETVAVDAQNSTTAVQNQVNVIQEIISIRSGRELWKGISPIGEETFPYVSLARYQVGGTSGGQGFPAHDHGAGTYKTVTPEIAATNAVLPWGIVRCGYVDEKATITLLARYTGTITNFYYDIYRMSDDGSWTLLHSSPDVKGSLIATLAWMQLGYPPFLTDVGDVIGIQFRVVGSGTVYLAGIETPAPAPPPGFYPIQMGVTRTTNNASASYTAAQIDPYYSGLVPYFQIGPDLGQLNTPRTFSDSFNRPQINTPPRWLLRASGTGGALLGIQSGRIVNPSSQLLVTFGDAMYMQPTVGDNMCVEWDQTGTTNVRSGCYICCDSVGRRLTMSVMTSTVEINSIDSFSGATITTRASVGGGGGGHYKLTYTLSDNTFRGYKNGVQIISWVDSTNQVAHGEGHRFHGVGIDHAGFTSGGSIDNYLAYDAEALT